ncbi:hypothetical protein Tco_0164812 [Tanacetum coccineum]
MHASKDDYLINTLRFVSTKETTQICGTILPESLTSCEIKETKAYQTYLDFATGATPPKIARKFKKPASPQLFIVLVSPLRTLQKVKRVKRPKKKLTKALSSSRRKDEDEEIGINTTSQLYDDVDIRLNELVDTDKGFIQEEVSALEKDVSELKKDDPLKTQVTALVDEHLDVRLGATRDEFMSYLSASITARITEQVKNQLPQILPKEVSNFAPRDRKACVILSHLSSAVLAKEARKGTKSQPKSSGKSVQSEEPEFEVADSYMPQDQEGNLGNDDDEPMKETYNLKRDWFPQTTKTTLRMHSS